MASTPWLVWGRGFEVRDRARSDELQLAYFARVDDLVYDEVLHDRYRRSGVDAVFFSYSITNATVPSRIAPRRKINPSEWGDDESATGLYVEASFPDQPGMSPNELDTWLAEQIRAVLEAWRKLRPSV